MIGKLVFIGDGIGLVVGETPNTQCGGGTLYRVRYVDFDTGDLMKCPDPRCKDGCVICSRGTTNYLRQLNDEDIELFVKEGMLKRKLVDNPPVK